MKRKRFSCSHAKGLCWVLILYNIWDSSILHAMVLSPWSRLVTDHRPGRPVDLEILSDLKILVGRDRDLRPRQRPQAEIPCKKSGPLCNSGMKWLHCWASRHSLGFEEENLGSSPGWWAATVATYCPSRLGNSPNYYLQNLANDGTPNSVLVFMKIEFLN